MTTFEQRDRAFLTAWLACRRLAGEPQQVFVDRTEAELEFELPSLSQRPLTWNQVSKLVRRGHVLGSHILTNFADDVEMRTEYAGSERRLEEELSSQVVHSSHLCPAMSPHWAPRSVKTSREAGFETAITIKVGLVQPPVTDNAS